MSDIKITKDVTLPPEITEQLLAFLRFASDDGCKIRWFKKLHDSGYTPEQCGKIAGLLKEVEIEIVLTGGDI